MGRLYDDDLAAAGIGLRKTNIAQSVWSDSQGCSAHVSLPGLHRGDHGIKVHVLHLQLHAEHVGHSLHDVNIDAYHTSIVVVLIGLERGIGGHHERAVGPANGLGLVGDAHLVDDMAVHDGAERTVVGEQAQGVVDALDEVTSAMSHTKGIRFRAEGMRQYRESLVLRHEGLGGLFVLYHAVHLALHECLYGIGGFSEPLHLSFRSVVLHLRHLRVRRSSELHAYPATRQVSSRSDGLGLMRAANQ